MKRYQERGGWFWVLLGLLVLILQITANNHGPWTPTIMALMLLSKAERISNALSDLHNGDDQ